MPSLKPTRPAPIHGVMLKMPRNAENAARLLPIAFLYRRFVSGNFPTREKKRTGNRCGERATTHPRRMLPDGRKMN
jgi:hypothetical protein